MSRLKSRIFLTLALAFFLGFPAVGILWFRSGMHRLIEADAKTDARIILYEAFAKGVPQLKKKMARSAIASWNEDEVSAKLARVGPLRITPHLNPVKSWVEAHQDQLWQACLLRGWVEGERAKANVELTVIRPHDENPHWVVKSLVISPR